MKKFKVVAVILVVMLLIGGIEIETVEPEISLKRQMQDLGVERVLVYRDGGSGEIRTAVYCNVYSQRLDMIDVNEPVKMTVAEKAVREIGKFMTEHFCSEPNTTPGIVENTAPRIPRADRKGVAKSLERPVS